MAVVEEVTIVTVDVMVRALPGDEVCVGTKLWDEEVEGYSR